MKAIYPKIDLLNNRTLATQIRILRDGKYYLVPYLFEPYKFDFDGYQRFIIEAELLKQFYKIPTNIINSITIELDPNQESEEERLKKYFPI